MEQLREDVRATAPRPRPEFAARLERNVEAGFKPARAPRGERRLNLLTPALALACTAVVAVFVAAVAIDGTSGDDEEGASGGVAMQQSAPPEEESGGSGGAAPPRNDAELRVPENTRAFDTAGPSTRSADPRIRDGRRVVEHRTALELQTPANEFAETTDEVLRVADDTGSIVQRSRVSEREGKGFARFDLRVPASRLDETLADLSRLAHVVSRTASTDDITRAYVSAADRLQDARDERRALLKALERADTEAEADAIRQQIELARVRIALAERDLGALRRRADRAKVSVTVRSTGRVSEGGAWTPGDAIDDAGRILEVAAGVVVVTAAALLPVAILAALAALAGRSVRRRRREAALDAR
ncbi:MAG TPA: DUF4349 domain-containing protein [Solirubrobacteraceae bacterium]|nr:DUF4349 domain-containing protein [Solirubrobacteraceae bacterium]